MGGSGAPAPVAIHQSTPTQGRVTFSDIGAHYIQNELPQKAHSTCYLHKHVVNDYLVRRWGNKIAVGIKPLDVEKWLNALRSEHRLANPTCAKIRAVMVCVYKHAQRHGLIPRAEDANPMRWVRCRTTSDYEPVILTPEQAFNLAQTFPLLERTLTLLAAATGLRISECLRLQWQDLDFENEKINVRRTWLDGRIGKPKAKASAQPVAMGLALAEIMKVWQSQTAYSKPSDWVFASSKLRGKKPRTGSIFVQNYLRPAAIKAGILAADDRRRFGLHNLRYSLASFLVSRAQTDVKTVQSMLRHANVSTTLDIYAHAIGGQKLAAQDQVMEAMIRPTLPDSSVSGV